MPEMYDVAIVGFGPSGAIAAGLLGAQGLRTFVCDKQAEVYDKPRAISLDHEISRLFQQMGLSARIQPYTEPFTDSVFYGVQGQVIKRMSTVAPPYPLGHNPSIVFSQPPVERILREHAQSYPNVTVALRQTVTQLKQDDMGVTLTLQGEGGQTAQVQARYVIACDGATSTVRALVGLELEDLEFDEPWLVVDVLVNEHGLAKLPVTSAQYCQPERPTSFLICPGNHRRWEISINPGEDPAQLATPDGTWQLLAPWITPADGTLWRQASYRFHALVTARWRAGRVFVAGDAAHQQPPFLGQGMCQGARDVVNLCWKLGAVLRGQAGERLLDSYGAERKGHVAALTTRIKHIGLLIGERDTAKALARDAQLLQDCGGVVQPTPRQDVQPALQAGLLSAQAHPARGTIFPQPWLQGPGSEPQRMDDVLGCGWRLVLAPQADSTALDLSAIALPALQCVQLGHGALIETEGVLARWFERHGVLAAIVRPDHYVYGVASTVLSLRSQFQELRQELGQQLSRQP